MKFTNKTIFFFSLLGIFYLFLLGFYTYFLENLFLQCPYPDFLSWDGNLRFITTIRMMDAFRSGNGFSLFMQIFDAPTWPTFRNILQMITFFIWEPNGKVDTNLTLFTYLIVCICIPYLYSLITIRKNSYHLFISSFFTLILLFHSDTILLYVFSPMLEIQGSLFTLLFLSTFYLFLTKKISILYPSLFGFLCYQTKYPYGYILIFFIFIFFSLLSWENLYLHLKDFLNFLEKTNKIYIILSVLLVGISFGFKSELQGKIPFYLNYLGFLIFTLLAVKFVLQINKSRPSPFSESLGYIVLPILIFTILHPDRVSSSVGTIHHIQSEGKIVGEVIAKDLTYYLSFFSTLYRDLWDGSYLGYFFLFLNLITFTNGLFFVSYKKKNIHPSFVFSSFIFISILGLTFLTPNHQARHVFHLFPSIILSGFLFLGESSFLERRSVQLFRFLLSFLFNSSAPLQKRKRDPYIRNIFYWTGIVLIGFLYAIYSPEKLVVWKRTPHLCYGGKIPIYDSAFFFEKELKNNLNQNVVLINLIDPTHLNKVDTELIFVKSAYEQKKKLALNLREYLKDPHCFRLIVLAGNRCNYSLANLEKQYRTKLEFKYEKRSENACLIFLEKQNP